MSLLARIQAAVAADQVEISDHAYEQMVARGIDFEETLQGLDQAILLEDYSEKRGEQRVLVAQRESSGATIHVVWDAPAEASPNVVLVTAFRPNR